MIPTGRGSRAVCSCGNRGKTFPEFFSGKLGESERDHIGCVVYSSCRASSSLCWELHTKRCSSLTTDLPLRCWIQRFPHELDTWIGGAVRADGELKLYLPNSKHRGQNASIIYKNTFLTGLTDIMRLQTKIKSRNNILPFVRKARSSTSLTQNYMADNGLFRWVSGSTEHRTTIPGFN